MSHSLTNLIAPGTAGNVLTSNGSVWESAVNSASGIGSQIAIATLSGTAGYIDISGLSLPATAGNRYLIKAKVTPTGGGGTCTMTLNNLGGTGCYQFWRGDMAAAQAYTTAMSFDCAGILVNTEYNAEILLEYSTANTCWIARGKSFCKNTSSVKLHQVSTYFSALTTAITSMRFTTSNSYAAGSYIELRNYTGAML